MLTHLIVKGDCMDFDKTIMFEISYGMYLIGSSSGERFNAQAANSVIQVSPDPDVIITACINKNNLTHRFIQETKRFSVSILSDRSSLEFIGWFGFRSGNKINKFGNEQFTFNYIVEDFGGIKIPVVTDNSLSYLIAEVVSSHDVGSHTVFFGKVVGGKKISDGKILTYSDYHTLKSGMTPKSAPSFIAQKE